MGMDIEVIGMTWYTVHLSNEDVEKVKQWLENHKDDLHHLIQKRIFQKRYGIYIARAKSLYLMMINVQKVILIQKKSDGQSLRNENQKKYLEKKY